jgi:transcription initiation factor IIE alpha subunit
MNKLYKLERAVRKYGSNVFISKDLARECNMTHNSMNRLLLKLEESGYAKVVGKQPTSNTGRPSRLIRLNFGYLE